MAVVFEPVRRRAQRLADRFVYGRRATPFAELLATRPGDAVDAAHARVGPETIAKFLFTSGSTKLPKAVVNTQRMLCANQQMIRQCFPHLADEPPVRRVTSIIEVGGLGEGGGVASTEVWGFGAGANDWCDELHQVAPLSSRHIQRLRLSGYTPDLFAVGATR